AVRIRADSRACSRGCSRAGLLAGPRAGGRTKLCTVSGAGLRDIYGACSCTEAAAGRRTGGRTAAFADRAERAEVQRRTRHLRRTSRGELPRIQFERPRSCEPQFVAEDVAAARACEVEAETAREVHDRGTVRAGEVGDLQCVVVAEVEDGLDRERP